MGRFLGLFKKSDSKIANRICTEDTKSEDTDQNTWICKSCGARNNRASLSCKECGKYR
jgi:hypothetical protein